MICEFLDFKKWYKKVSLGVPDFNFLNAFTAWNVLVDDLQGYSIRRKYKGVMLVK